MFAVTLRNNYEIFLVLEPLECGKSPTSSVNFQRIVRPDLDHDVPLAYLDGVDVQLTTDDDEVDEIFAYDGRVA